MATAQLDERAAGPSPVSPARGGRHLSLVVAAGVPGGRPRPAVPPGGPRVIASTAPPRGRVRPVGRRVGGGGAAVRAARAGCAGPRPERARGARLQAPPLRLTRRGRRLVAGLAIALGLALAAVVGGAVLDGSSSGLRLAGETSVVVRSGDTLWSIARGVAPEEDPRAVVDAIVTLNDLAGVGLVPGQVLQLP